MNELESTVITEETEKNQNNKNFGYILGRVFGAVIVGCLSSLAIATTVRLIAWIL